MHDDIYVVGLCLFMIFAMGLIAGVYLSHARPHAKSTTMRVPPCAKVKVEQQEALVLPQTTMPSYPRELPPHFSLRIPKPLGKPHLLTIPIS